MRQKLLATVATIAVAATAVMIGPADDAEALSGSEFIPGYIISDELFYNGNAMTAAGIQAFLDNSIGSCLTDRCLNVAMLPVTSRPASYSVDTGGLVCTAIEGGTLAVSELIYRAQVACGISARVILVTLQKEQGLVTSRAPSDWALRAAMGMGCPDTAPCSDAFAGLATQIMSGTRQLKVYKVGRFGRQPGVNFIQYHPNADCGGTEVVIRNDATAALYNYTPYQPNAASLANLGTTGDGCSSYGNRNFWAYYNQWFGPSIEVPCAVNPSRDINRYWTEQGGVGGALGAPVSPGIVGGPAGTTVGYYANGAIYCTPRLGAVGVVADIGVKYAAMGGPSSALGSPTAARTPFTAGGIAGSTQLFQRGTMITSPTTGTFAVLDGPIRTAWGDRGGSGGVLGWPIGDHEIVAGGARQQFQRGLIMAPTGKPAIILSGDVGAYWATGTNASILGSPTTAATALTAGGVAGTIQSFDRGMVLSSSTTGTYAVLNGAMRNAWGSSGGSGGSLGWPTGDQVVAGDGFRQDFQRGTIFASTTGVGATLSGDIAAYWTSGSNAGRLGYPTGASTPWTAGGVTGTLQYFERGMVLSSTTTGTHAVVTGAIRDAWGARGGSGGSLGWPTGEQQTVGGNLQQQFQGGLLSLGSGLSGDIATYVGTGSNAARLGSAAGAPIPLTAGGITGVYQVFQRGMVLSSPTTGTFAVLDGAIRNAWGASGGSGGSLGWPTADQESVSGGVRQQFERGVMMVPNGGAGAPISGDIGTYWSTGSNGTRLGSPNGAPSAWTSGGVTGTLQYFQRGMVLSSSTTGTYSVLTGAIRDAWGAAGGSGGSLGWPTGDQESVSGGVRQQFQRGVVIVPTGGTGSVLSGDIATYWSTDSNATRLGQPTSSPSAWSAGGVSGLIQYFQRGMVLSSTTTGTHAVLTGPLRTAYGIQGGTAGSLGWPTGEQEVVAAGGVQQSFERGVLGISSGGATIVLSGAYYTYWSAASNSTLLGAPTAPVVTWSAGGTSGSYLTFEKAMVMSSTTTGTFAVLNGPIRDLWGELGGSVGSLGWPTSDQTPGAEGVRQEFQHGAILVPTSGPATVVPR